MESKNKKEFRILSAKVDVIFKLLFGDARNKRILTNFLEDVLSLSTDEYEEIKIVDPILKRESIEDKLSVVDVKLVTKTGKIVHIEIQLVDQDDMPERSVYYNSKILVSQIKSGEHYSKLQKVISIIIVDFDMINNEKYHNVFQLREQDTGIKFSDIIEINTLEMTKAIKSTDNSSKHDWLMFLKAESREELDMIAERNPRVTEAVAELVKLSESEENQMIYEGRQKALLDKESQIMTAVRKNTIEVARNLFKINLPIEQISEVTGLPIKELQNLKSSQ